VIKRESNAATCFSKYSQHGMKASRDAWRFGHRCIFSQTFCRSYISVKALYFQTLCGASGDMILSSCIDVGVPLEHVQTECSRLAIDGLKIEVEKVKRGGLICSHVNIGCAKQTAYRHLPQILALIQQAGYAKSVFDNCERVLTRLAEAEARVHNVALEKVHFHEIGAVDTIVDILGTCLCLDYLGVTDVLFSTLTVGRGAITTAHGIMPVPAPATTELIKGAAVQQQDIDTEILTPTGAALLTGLGRQVACMPEGVVGTIGYGCGDKVFEQYPNMLRAMLLESCENRAQDEEGDCICIMESDMDHISGEIMAFAAERLFDAGALDVSWSPIFMKKGRPGYRLCVMGRPQHRDALIECIIAQTHTLGVRYRIMQRAVARRCPASIRRDGAELEIKQSDFKGMSFSRPEYESIAKRAREQNIPLIELMEKFYCRDADS
jgi:uncharacterized protein (TIGR00299 family) protein